MSAANKLRYGRQINRLEEFLAVLKDWYMLGDYPKMEYEVYLAIEHLKKKFREETEDDDTSS